MVGIEIRFLKAFLIFFSLHAYIFTLQESRRRFDKAIHAYDQVLNILHVGFEKCA